MMKKNIFVKNTGFSYLELIFSLFIIINIFVLFNQIFYNINIKTKIDYDKRIIEYEVVVVRIERDLKEAKNLQVYENFITYEYKNRIYKYFSINNKLALNINNSITIYYLYDIKTIYFYKFKYYIKIIFIDNFDNIYESRVLYS